MYKTETTETAIIYYPFGVTSSFAIDHFASNLDTTTVKDYSGPLNVSQLSAESLFEAKTEDGWLTLTLPVQIINGTMTDHSIGRIQDDGTVNGSLETQSIHQ